MSHWTPYVPDSSQPWDRRRVVHLHRRATFGACRSEIERDVADGVEPSVSRLFSGQGRQGVPEGFAQLADVIGQSAVDSGTPERLKAWWLYRCLFSPQPLVERLTLMWHNHFATSNLKVADLKLMKQQNDLLRAGALLPFGKLLVDMAHDPALLVWLDAPSNEKGHPNENLAREIMELFSLGVGNYTEDDVKQAARALTGWTVRQGNFRDRPASHDAESKTILGQTGAWTGDDLVRILGEHPATSKRLAWRLTREFFADGVVEPPALEELAAGLREHQLDIHWAVETILRSRLFFSDANIGTRVSDPVTYVVGSLRALECWRDPPSSLVLAEWVTRMGQDLFYPPNVGGWNGGKTWLSTRTVVARANFAAALVEGRLSSPPRVPGLAMLFNGGSESWSKEEGVRDLCDVLFGEAPPRLIKSVETTLSQSGDREQCLRQAVIALLASPRGMLH